MAKQTLFTLVGPKKYGPFARQQVETLFRAGRLAGDALICALHGPWMRLEDFFGTRPPPVAIKTITVSTAHEPVWSDDWQVKVRGIPSARVTGANILQLFQAREITPDNVVCHSSWNEHDWRPIRTIPQLSRLLDS